MFPAITGTDALRHLPVRGANRQTWCETPRTASFNIAKTRLCDKSSADPHSGAAGMARRSRQTRHRQERGLCARPQIVRKPVLTPHRSIQFRPAPRLGLQRPLRRPGQRLARRGSPRAPGPRFRRTRRNREALRGARRGDPPVAGRARPPTRGASPEDSAIPLGEWADPAPGHVRSEGAR